MGDKGVTLPSLEAGEGTWSIRRLEYLQEEN